MTETMEVRWIILIVGVVLIGAVYMLSLRRQHQDRLRQRQRMQGAREPELGQTDLQKSTLHQQDMDVGGGGAVTETASQWRESDHDYFPSQQPLAENSSPQSLAEARAATRSEDSPSPVTSQPPAEERPPSPGEEESSASTATPPPTNAVPVHPQLTLCITVISGANQWFRGPTIEQTLHQLSMYLHSSGLYYYRHPQDDEGMIRIAHLRSPGTFDPATLPKLRTPGLLIIMQFPTTQPARIAVERWFEVAREIAQQLGGFVADEHRRRLLARDFHDIRCKALDFERSLNL